MNERSVAQACVNHLRQALRGAVVIKHADKTTASIPDVSVTALCTTWWLELKFTDKPLHDWLAQLTDRQRVTCRQLYAASGRRCWVVVYAQHRDDRGQMIKYTAIVDPRTGQPIEGPIEGFAHHAVAALIRRTARST